MAKGWVKINRSIQDHWLWNDEPFSKGQAWIDLIMLANYEDKKTMYKGETITCERGVVNLSLSCLASRWKWSRWKVTNFLKALESDNMVTTNCTTNRTTITLVNYRGFQDLPTANCTTDLATNRQRADTTKKDKNLNNVIYSNKFNRFEPQAYNMKDIEESLGL